MAAAFDLNRGLIRNPEPRTLKKEQIAYRDAGFSEPRRKMPIFAPGSESDRPRRFGDEKGCGCVNAVHRAEITYYVRVSLRDGANEHRRSSRVSPFEPSRWHDTQHEFSEKRHGEFSVAVGRAVDHALF